MVNAMVSGFPIVPSTPLASSFRQAIEGFLPGYLWPTFFRAMVQGVFFPTKHGLNGTWSLHWSWIFPLMTPRLRGAASQRLHNKKVKAEPRNDVDEPAWAAVDKLNGNTSACIIYIYRDNSIQIRHGATQYSMIHRNTVQYNKIQYDAIQCM